jgi:hypothetical protein
LSLNCSVWFFLYRQKMSPRVSDWKSQGETNTMSPSRIHTRLFSLPRTLHNRSLPSWHLTIIRSKPSIFTATPSTSFLLGNNMFSKFSSLMTFLLPNFRTSRTIRKWLPKGRDESERSEKKRTLRLNSSSRESQLTKDASPSI